MRVHRFIVVALAALVLSGCAGMPRKKTGIVPPPPALRTTIGEVRAPVVPVSTAVVAQPVVVPAAVIAPAPIPNYVLDSGDRLRIVVFGQEGLSNTYAVDADGNVMLPLIGTVPARGLTKEDLAHTITRLLAKTYIREPHVAIEIELYRPFFILGEVTAPGQYPFVANMTVEQAVAIAGGFAPRAWKGPVEIRRRLNGAIVRIAARPIDPICPGDTLTIAERWF
jgi:polysaccharide export outer membrane protein